MAVAPQGPRRRSPASRGAGVPDHGDPYLSLRDLAAYASLSVRTLRKYLDDPRHPLPHYRVGGKIVVRVSEFNQWLSAYRVSGRVDVKQIVDDVLTSLRNRTPRMRRDRP